VLRRLRGAPFGGNLQPWQIFLWAGDELLRLKGISSRAGCSRRPAGKSQSIAVIIPRSWSLPYRDTVFQLGEDLYAELGYPHVTTKAGRLAWLRQKLSVFSHAPLAAVLLRRSAQWDHREWSDLGMFLQSLMLLAA